MTDSNTPHGAVPDGGTDEALVRRWFEELFNRGEPAVIDEILAPDVSYHGPPSLSPGDATGVEPIREFVEVYATAFPDLWYTVESISQAGDEIRVRWSATGTHESDLFGLEATGESFTVSGIDIFVVEDGRITEIHAQWDTLKLVQELGVVPPVGTAAE
jgi:steroid delta-isomerase-like uncharacterized protein